MFVSRIASGGRLWAAVAAGTNADSDSREKCGSRFRIEARYGSARRRDNFLTGFPPHSAAGRARTPPVCVAPYFCIAVFLPFTENFIPLQKVRSNTLPVSSFSAGGLFLFYSVEIARVRFDLEMDLYCLFNPTTATADGAATRCECAFSPDHPGTLAVAAHLDARRFVVISFLFAHSAGLFLLFGFNIERFVLVDEDTDPLHQAGHIVLVAIGE